MNKFCAALAAVIAFSGAAQAEDGNWSVYGGADYVLHEVSVTVPIAAPDTPDLGTIPGRRRVDGDGNSIRLNGGFWLNEDFAVEIQGMVDSDSVEGPDTAEIDSYYGVFIRARADLFDWLDMSFPLGVTSIETTVPDTETENPGDNCVMDGNGDLVYCPVTASNDGVAFGMDLNFKVAQLFADQDSAIAGLDITLGFMVYNESGNASVRGYNAGLHFGYDF